MAFEQAAATPAERNEGLLATPVTVASGKLKGLLLQDREDRKRVARVEVDRAVGRSRSSMADAIAWAALAGFTPDQQSLAASAALVLRGSLGAGRVTKRLVFERCRAQYPDLFDEVGTREQAA